jgi:hypothetical protein
MVSNRDIGFVHVDQEAEIEVDTLNFTRYGLLHARVSSVSQDAISSRRSRTIDGARPHGIRSLHPAAPSTMVAKPSGRSVASIVISCQSSSWHAAKTVLTWLAQIYKRTLGGRGGFNDSANSR